jgi:hypothetical protein
VAPEDAGDDQEASPRIVARREIAEFVQRPAGGFNPDPEGSGGKLHDPIIMAQREGMAQHVQTIR